MLEVTIDDKTYLRRIVPLSNPEVIRLLALAIRSALHERIAPYPAASSANRPQAGKTHYKRGTGTVYTRKRGGKTVRRTSEMAGRKWHMSVRGTNALLSNTASYSGYLWSEAYQPKFHQQRGWKAWETEWKKMQADGTVNDILTDVITTVTGGP